MRHSLGHDVPQDNTLYKECGCLTPDEAAILYHCARNLPGNWVDIGSCYGWSAAHIAVAGCVVHAVDPVYGCPPRFRDADVGRRFLDRAQANVSACNLSDHVIFETTAQLTPDGVIQSAEKTGSFWFFKNRAGRYSGVHIDGEHFGSAPLEDARMSLLHLEPTGVIVFHDFALPDVRLAVRWLRGKGMGVRIYNTPHLVAVCWRGDFHPPGHIPDASVNWTLLHTRIDNSDWLPFVAELGS
jgi:hypothetical protein